MFKPNSIKVHSIYYYLNEHFNILSLFSCIFGSGIRSLWQRSLRNPTITLYGYASNHCHDLVINKKKVYPQEQGVAKDSKSKQTHVGFSMSILVESQGACMQIKNNLLHIFPIVIWLEEGNLHYCCALGIALKCLGRFSLEIQTKMFCNSFRRDKAATRISANKIARLTLTQLYFKLA